MEISPEPKDIDLKIREFLKVLMGEDGLTFLDLDNAITAVKQGHLFWQAPFTIGLHALPLLYHIETDSQSTAFPDLVLLVSGLASQTHLKSKDMTVSDLVDLVLEPLEAQYASLSAEVSGYGLTDKQAHTLFHTRLALSVLLLVKGDEERGRTMIRQMANTKMKRRGPTISLGVGLGHWDMEVTKALAAIILQDFCARRQDYELALYVLQEAVASNSPGLWSEYLLAIVPRLLESFVQKCESVNSFDEWIDLFDRAAGIIDICGEADISGDLPSGCKVASPQFLAWEFGKLVAHFAMRSGFYLDDSKQLLSVGYPSDELAVDSILREGGYGSDWGNGTVVASLLCEYDEHRNWHVLRQQYVSMWESSSRYQWLSLCQAGTETDLYWAIRIGFADHMLSATEQRPIVRDIEMIKDIASTIALQQMKVQFDLGKVLESLQKLSERQPPDKQEIHQQLQQSLRPVWSKLPATVVETLVTAVNYYRTGVNTNDAKEWFHKAVEASLHCCLVEPLVSFMQKRGNNRIAICFSPPRGVEQKTSSELRNKLRLWEWSDVLETISVPANKSLASLGSEDLRQFMKEHFGELSLPALRELARSLRDFYLRKDSAHYHIPRYEEETRELEQMRELVLGKKRPSVITQIFQLFGTER